MAFIYYYLRLRTIWNASVYGWPKVDDIDFWYCIGQQTGFNFNEQKSQNLVDLNNPLFKKVWKLVDFQFQTCLTAVHRSSHVIKESRCVKSYGVATYIQFLLFIFRLFPLLPKNSVFPRGVKTPFYSPGKRHFPRSVLILLRAKYFFGMNVI